MDTSDKELFDSALSDEPIEQVEAQAEPAQEAGGQPRDESGRFAPKEQAVEAAPAQAEPAPQGKDEAHVPSWRLREERERAEAAETRARQIEANWQRQFQELQSRLPKPDEPKAPDVFEDPNKFLEYGVQRAVDPIKSEIGQLREFYSRREAIREHGQEKVTAAYNAIAQGMQSRDPEVMATYQRAMQSMDPFGEIVSWHQQKTVFNQIGNDPNKWFEQELEKRLSDPQFASAQLQRIQNQVRGAPPQSQGSIVQLPPSIGKVPSSHSASDDVGDMSDAGLFAHAMR